MCSPATCPTCRKTTWTGCGMHADQVLAGVRPQDRCECSTAPARLAVVSASVFHRAR